MSKNESKKSCRGITLIELLVVIAITSIVAVLLLAAVQAARQASRKIACTNNLKQIGIALNSYEAVYGVYPQGVNGFLASAHVALLPHIEQGVLFNSINYACGGLTGGFSDGECNGTAGRTRLATYCCPADPDIWTPRVTSYGWNGGFGDQRENFVGTFSSGGGQNYRYISSANIKDGLSQTAAMSEWRLGRVNSMDPKTVVFRVDMPDSQNYQDFINTCQMSKKETTSFGSWMKGANWNLGFYGSTVLNFNTTPNSIACLCDKYSNNMGNWPSGSYHNGGSNVLFHDSHVKLFKNTVSLDVWQAISSRSGNDIRE